MSAEEIKIIAETTHYLVLNKQAGLIVEKNPYEFPTVEDLVYQYLEEKQKKVILGIVHRLDRVTSGVLIMAKKKSALRHLNQQFAERKVRKTYLAITASPPKERKGTLIHWLEKDQKNKRAIIHEKPKKNAVQCQLNYEIVASTSSKTLLTIQPTTGKFHQIRAQLAYIGCPIIGDQKYGATNAYFNRAIALHAHQLTFIDPLTETMKVAKAPTPDNEWWQSFSSHSDLY